ncbi:MAG TPA: YfiR family protein [Casimicrobiaceae bacterium]|nr:YfiR family protein [Casimicrobiaceae bacterium]
MNLVRAVPGIGSPAFARASLARGRGFAWLLLTGCFAYLLVLAAWSAPGVSAAEDPPVRQEEDVKAAFLYKFPAYVDWRPGTFGQPSSPIVIGVTGDDAVAEALRMLVAGRKAGERPIQIRQLAPGAFPDGIHLLFVGRAASSHVPRLAPLAARQGVLLVTDYEGALDDGSAINLLVIDHRVRFEVSLDATEQAGLKLSSRLLAVALWVRPAR